MKRRLARVAGSLGAAALVLVAFGGPVAAALPPAPVGVVVTGSPSNFESGDGNMTVDFSTLGVNDTDWNCFTIGPKANCKTTTGAQFITADATGEVQWVSGQKFDTLCPATNTGNNPPKDEFVNIAQFSESDASLNEFFYGANIRSTANGNASGDIEFDHNKGATPTSMPCRVAGDILMAYDFLNGGTTAGGNAASTCFVKTDSLPCWGSNVITPSGAISNGRSNQSPIAAADNGMSGIALPVNQFSEFGINLSQALGISGQCLSFPQQTWESRSSGSSFTSNPQDLEISQHTINNCGEVVVIKQTSPRGQNQAFSFNSNIAGSQLIAGTASGVTGAPCREAATGYTGSYTLNDNGNSTSNSAGNTDDCAQVPAGTFTISEGTEPNGFTFSGLTCTADSTSGSTVTTSNETATVNLKGGGLVTCVYGNVLNTATIATQVSDAGPVFPGVAVHDTATVTGSQTADTPSGTVTFSLCGPIATGSCSSDGTSAGTGTLSGSGATASANSADVNTLATPLAPGRYCFRANWPGDTNYVGALTEFGGTNGTNECFTVRTIPTTTTTTPSVVTTTFGSSVTDHAVVQANQAGDGTPTGTVTFFICDPTQTSGGACPDPNGTQVGSPVPTADNGGTPPSSFADSSAVTVNMTGTWCFRAVYTPGGANGANYTGSSDASSGECFTVTDTTGSTSAQNWLPNDSATVTATNGAPLNGTLSAQLYTGDNCGATGGSAVSGQLYTKTLANATSAADRTLTTSNSSFTVSTSTSVSWLVSFGSSDPNVGSSSHCEVTTLNITN